MCGVVTNVRTSLATCVYLLAFIYWLNIYCRWRLCYWEASVCNTCHPRRHIFQIWIKSNFSSAAVELFQFSVTVTSSIHQMAAGVARTIKRLSSWERRPRRRRRQLWPMVTADVIIVINSGGVDYWPSFENKQQRRRRRRRRQRRHQEFDHVTIKRPKEINE